MTEKKGPGPLEIQSWEALNGTTWAVCDYYAILSMHRSLEEAEATLEAVKEARAEREKQWASPSE